MKTTITSITGFAEAFESMFISKRSWTPELAEDIRRTCALAILEYDEDGYIAQSVREECRKKFNKWLEMLLKMGRKHITVLRFIDITIMTEGLHRGGQD